MNDITPLDEFPLHQAPLPLAYANSSDRNFYDRWYFNAHDRSGEIFVISGMGYYPNLGTKDAFLLVARGGKQTAVHLSDVMDQDRLNPHVGNYRVEVIDPLNKLRIVLEETDGIVGRPDLGRHLRGHPGACRTCCAPAAGSPSTPSGSPSWAPGAAPSLSTAR